MRDPGILVVESNLEILDTIGRMFGYFRIKVDSVTSAALALDTLQQCHYKVMLIALNLPEMVGAELARRAHDIDDELNVVLYVADSPEQVLRLTLAPTVSDISEVPLKEYNFGDMLLDIKHRETGKIFLLE